MTDIVCGSVTSFSPFLLAVALTSEELIQDILDGVADLEGLPGNVAGSLTSKLDNVLTRLSAGNLTAAINQLDAFILEMEALIHSGQLAHVAGEPLIDLAHVVIAKLSA